MSTTSPTKTPTIAQRGSAAVTRAATHLSVDDIKRLSTALLEVGAELLERDQQFAERVRGQYDGLASRPRAASRPRRAQPPVELKPIKQIDTIVAAGSTPDPYFLLELYGIDQLPAALDRYTRDELRASSGLVRERNPGSKPSGTGKPAYLAYILAHVTNGK